MRPVGSCLHFAGTFKLQVFAYVPTHPKINQEFAAGNVSYSKVRAMTRAATDDNESQLLEAAQNHTANYMGEGVQEARNAAFSTPEVESG